MMNDRELYLHYRELSIAAMMKAWDIIYPIQDVLATSVVAQLQYAKEIRRIHNFTSMGATYADSASVLASERNILKLPDHLKHNSRISMNIKVPASERDRGMMIEALRTRGAGSTMLLPEGIEFELCIHNEMGNILFNGNPRADALDE